MPSCRPTAARVWFKVWTVPGVRPASVSVTFFPAFVTIAQGLALMPPTVQDFVRAYGGGRWRQLQLVAIPWSVPYLCAAARLPTGPYRPHRVVRNA